MILIIKLCDRVLFEKINDNTNLLKKYWFSLKDDEYGHLRFSIIIIELLI